MFDTSTRLNFSREARIEYVPGGSNATEKKPSLFVVTSRFSDVALFRTTILTPETTAPDSSTTVPLRVADVDWAVANEAVNSRADITSVSQNERLRILNSQSELADGERRPLKCI
jgi:hypothetical protein